MPGLAPTANDELNPPIFSRAPVRAIPLSVVTKLFREACRCSKAGEAIDAVASAQVSSNFMMNTGRDNTQVARVSDLSCCNARY